MDRSGPGSVTIDDVLTHFGVKGMKWGVRRNRVQLGRGPKPSASEDAARAKTFKTTAKRGGSDALSTKDLQELVNRMNLEKQYNSLKPTPVGIKIAQNGAKFASDIVLNAGKQTATKLVANQMGKQVEKLLKSAGA